MNPEETTSQPRKLVPLIEAGGAQKGNQKNERAAPARARKIPGPVEWTDEDLASAREALRRNLHATKVVWDKDAKMHVEVADATAQIAAGTAIINQALGLPVQRIVRMEVAHKDRLTELMEVARTPSGRDMLLKAGIIDHDWLAKYLPDESQQAADSQKRELAQVPDVEE